MIFERSSYPYSIRGYEYCAHLVFDTGLSFKVHVIRTSTRRVLEVYRFEKGELVSEEKFFVSSYHHPLQIIGEYFSVVCGFDVTYDNNKIVIHGTEISFDN